MTIQEAITHGNEELDIFGGEHAEFIKMAIESLEKQIPKNVVIVDKGYKQYSCPLCNMPMEFIDPKYCCECGQAIDWSEAYSLR